MDDHIHTHMPLFLKVTAISFIFILINLPQSHCEEEKEYTICSRPYNCGNLTNISYPFWGESHPPFCGGGDDSIELNCQDNKTTSFRIGPQNFSLLEINNNNYTLRIVRTDLAHDACSSQLGDTKLGPYLSLPPDPETPVYKVSIAYKCSGVELPPGHNYNFTCGNDNAIYYVDSEAPREWTAQVVQNCKQHIEVPAEAYFTSGGIDGLQRVLRYGFHVKYSVAPECINCWNTGGVCGSNDTAENEHHNHFSCYCPDGSYGLECHVHESKLNVTRKIKIGVASGVFGAIVVFIACYVWYRRKKNSYAMSYMQSRSLSSDPSLKDTEKGSLTIAPGVHLFSYSELEEATNYFDASRELGEGGFGTVYFGKLQDGRCVAVKRLYENNYRRVEQFMNEIRILARLVHPNLVTLYGCTSRHGRELLLVYEYIPNGTVADHLHGERTKPGTLPWHIRMNIAVETASALKYLHVSDIIHRDVKTNNILLDSHFRVKVADFGLSRLFPNDVTHISTAPQGTPGYVDPEYHECYQLTSKSDVYSFGVVLIELISSLPAVDITRHRHEINLANMAINKIHNQALHELVDPTLGFESDEKVRKMINLVAELGFQCLQSSKDMRPSMEEVLDTLKDIQSGGKRKSQPEVMDISSSAADDVVLLKDDPPPPSPDSNAVSKSTTPNASG